MGRKNNMPWFTLILCLTIFLSFAKAQTNTTTTLTLHRRSPPATCRPRPQKEYVTFVLMDFTGFPIKVTDTVLDRLSVSFRRVYNRLSVHQCDALYRYVRSVSARVIDEGIGVAATFANPAIITVAFRVEYLCFGCECPERGFLLAPDDIVTPLANSTYNNYFFTSRTTRALHELHQQLQEDDEMPFDEEEEEETMLFDEQDVMEFDDKEDDHDYSWLNDPFLVESSERHRRELQILDLSHFPPLPTVDPLLEDGRPPPCGCTNPRADYNAPTSRELVFGYRRAVLEGQSLAAASVLSLLTALEVSPVDCTGLDGAPGGPIEEFNQTLTYTIAADPFNVTAIERGLLGNILTSTFNYYSRINCDGRFLELDETVVLDDITIPPSRLLRRRLELVTNIGGFTGGRCRGCRSDYMLGDEANNEARRLEELLEQQRRLQRLSLTRRPTPSHLGLASLTPRTCVCSAIAGTSVVLNDALNETIQTDVDFQDFENVDTFINVVFDGVPTPALAPTVGLGGGFVPP